MHPFLRPLCVLLSETEAIGDGIAPLCWVSSPATVKKDCLRRFRVQHGTTTTQNLLKST